MSDSVHLDLFTERSEDSFQSVDSFPNESGNVVISFDKKNFATLTPKMAKRLARKLNEASRDALADTVSE